MSAPESPKGGRPKGLDKTGGRGAGTPNKKTLLLREKLNTLGYDPVEDLIKIACDPKTALDVRVHIHVGFLSYLYPKRKPVDELREEPVTMNVITELDRTVGGSNGRAESTPAAETTARDSIRKSEPI